jgi:hypothetical protein
MFLRKFASWLLSSLIFLLLSVPVLLGILIGFVVLLIIVGVTLLPAVLRTPINLGPPPSAHAFQPLIILPIGLGFFALLFLSLLLLGRVPVGYNLRNLLVRWRTTLMTALAFTLIVALMTVMLAFVNGLYRLTGNSAQPGNIVILADGALDESMSSLGNASSTSPIYLLNQEQRQYVASDEHGEPLVSLESYIVAAQQVQDPQGRSKRRFLQIRGLTEPAMTAQVHGLSLYPGGHWFSQAGVQPIGRLPNGQETSEQAIQAVLGEGIARVMGADLYQRPLQPGDLFEVGTHKWVVTGIMESAGSTFDSEVWAKMQIAGPLFGRENWTTCVLRTSMPEHSKEFADALTKEVKNPAIKAQTEVEYYDKLNTTNQQFLVAIIVVTAILAVGSIFGIMNTMFAAISQRTKDIGVMRIIGFSRWQMLFSFFLESLFIAAIGGILGCALGYVANGWSASSIVSGGAGGKSVVLKLIVDGPLVASGMLFTLTMGALGGLLPALSAMRLKPLESLR